MLKKKYVIFYLNSRYLNYSLMRVILQAYVEIKNFLQFDIVLIYNTCLSYRYRRIYRTPGAEGVGELLIASYFRRLLYKLCT